MVGELGFVAFGLLVYQQRSVERQHDPERAIFVYRSSQGRKQQFCQPELFVFSYGRTAAKHTAAFGDL